MNAKKWEPRSRGPGTVRTIRAAACMRITASGDPHVFARSKNGCDYCSGESHVNRSTSTTSSMKEYSRGMRALALVCVLAACGGAPPPPPPAPVEAPCDRVETIQLRLIPRAQLNPDREGYSRSVVARIYQLDGEAGIASLDFDSLWLQAAAAPPSSPSVLASPDELTLVPGREAVHELKRITKATHVAVVAKFREHHPTSGWRAVAALPMPTNACQVPVGPRLIVELVNYSLRIN
ncbi:MAG TPA: type VI secretion system lipoprotein TssJ [Polyangiales bacterium]|nr:type VI secretion system lipoprotein TssJ [Polyangiales bacterium]